MIFWNNTASIPPEVVVVLAVTPQQSEVIRFAQVNGNVSLAMRSPGDYGSGDTPTTGITQRIETSPSCEANATCFPSGERAS